jgi:hypothetical protein
MKSENTNVQPKSQENTNNHLANKSQVEEGLAIPRLRHYLDASHLAALAATHRDCNAFFQPLVLQRMLKSFLQAVVDDDRNTVQATLDSRPELLLENFENRPAIESQLTWQVFTAEPVVKILIKRGQIEMLKCILPYFEKLERKGALVQAKHYVLKQIEQAHEEMQQQPLLDLDALVTQITDGLDEITIGDMTSHIIDKFNGGIPERPVTEWTGERLKEKIQSFRDTLLPQKAVSLSNYYNIELHLYASIAASEQLYQLEGFDNMGQNLSIAVYYQMMVVGFLQSLVNPELAKTIQAGIEEVLDGKTTAEASQLKPKNPHSQEDYYREKESEEGLGYTTVIIDLSAESVRAYIEKNQETLQTIEQKLTDGLWPYFYPTVDFLLEEEEPHEECSLSCTIL